MEELPNPEMASELKKYQLRSLAKLHKKHQTQLMTEILVREGLDDKKTWEMILNQSMENGEDQDFMKLLNTAINFSGEEIVSKEQLLKKMIAAASFRGEHEKKRGKELRVSKYPEYNFKFDEKYMQK